jgi:hypothetical protein
MPVLALVARLLVAARSKLQEAARREPAAQPRVRTP